MAVEITVELRGMTQVFTILDKSLKHEKRVESELHESLSRIALPRLRYAIPRGKTGRLARAAQVRHLKERAGEIAAVSVGINRKQAPHGHLITGGVKPHAIYSPEGKRLKWKGREGKKIYRHDAWHPGTRGKAFVRSSMYGIEGMVAADLAKKYENAVK